MISRVAESCYWLARYMERAESTARAIEANLTFVLDVGLESYEHWRPLVIVSGESERFAERYPDGTSDAEAV
ncbi:MAG: alpha-E domain-containing protein, partial [Phycisphaerales bacterium]|nr:alpha-E domain-containing protein [Phycisphaerales bacterium]